VPAGVLFRGFVCVVLAASSGFADDPDQDGDGDDRNDYQDEQRNDGYGQSSSSLRGLQRPPGLFPGRPRYGTSFVPQTKGRDPGDPDPMREAGGAEHGKIANDQGSHRPHREMVGYYSSRTNVTSTLTL
jgi:hypothetical protein